MCSRFGSFRSALRHTPNHFGLYRWSAYQFQMKAENAQKMLTRKDGRVMSTYEIEALFKNSGKILEEVAKDPKGYTPTHLDETEKLIADIRQVKLEYAPDQLKYISSNFMVWYHGYKAKQIFGNLHSISTQYDLNSTKKENQFNSFSKELLEWNKHLTNDMEIVWECLDGIDTKLLAKDMELEDEEEGDKLVRSFRTNCSLYLNNYNKYLFKSYDDIMQFSKSISFLEFDEQQLALTAAPFLGKFDVMHSLIDKMTAEKERETKKNPEILIDKVLDLPTGLDWYNLYCMYKEGSKYKQIIENWENDQDEFYEMNDRKALQRNVNDICWFTMDKFESKIVKCDVTSVDDNGNEIRAGTETEWEEIKKKYLDDEYNKLCDRITENNSLIRKMGNTCQIICLLGSEQSIFGSSILHLTGLWLNNFSNVNGDGDRILVTGKNALQMNDDGSGKDVRWLIHEEEWDLYQQYSINKDTVFVAGMCDTEQRIQSHEGKKLRIDNIPSVIRLRTQIQMTLSKH